MRHNYCFYDQKAKRKIIQPAKLPFSIFYLGDLVEVTYSDEVEYGFPFPYPTMNIMNINFIGTFVKPSSYVFYKKETHLDIEYLVKSPTQKFYVEAFKRKHLKVKNINNPENLSYSIDGYLELESLIDEGDILFAKPCELIIYDLYSDGKLKKRQSITIEEFRKYFILK